jgi:hypothetical protein
MTIAEIEARHEELCRLRQQCDPISGVWGPQHVDADEDFVPEIIRESCGDSYTYTGDYGTVITVPAQGEPHIAC